MRNIESCFFCTTPYQIITAIAIERQLGEKADLYVVDQFAGAEECVERIKAEKLFSEVRLIKYRFCKSKNKVIIWSWVIVQYCKIKRIVKETLVPETNYKKVYASGRDMTFRCIWIFLTKTDPSVKRINFDDGVGSYVSDRFLLLFRKGDLLIQRIFFRSRVANRMPDSQMLFSPELYYSIHGVQQRKIEKIECDFNNEKTIGIYNRIFNYQLNESISERVILLDCLKNESLNQQEKDSLLKIYMEIFERIGKEDIIIKRHPRDKEEKEDGVNYYLDDQIPFECVYMNMDCSTKVLISLSSTAVVTPKLLLNQEPFVILLYKLVWTNNQDIKDLSQIDSFFQSLKKTYLQPGRFVIPETLDELITAIKIL